MNIPSLPKAETLFPERSLIISFDDGYLDNLENAFPVLKSYDMPAVLYLATRYIDYSEPQWVDRLHSILKFRNNNRVTIDFLHRSIWNLADSEQYKQLFSELNELFIGQTYEQRNQTLVHLEEIFGFRKHMPRLTLNWEDVEHINREYPRIELGIHTDQHLDLSSHKNDMSDELRISAKKVARITNREPVHFSYPYGRAFDNAHILLEEHGIRTAVGTTPDYRISANKPHYYLPRLDTGKYSRRLWRYAVPGS